MINDADNILCACSAYEQKYYFNNRYDSLPELVKQELQIMCVLFTEDVGGEFYVSYDDDGSLHLSVNALEDDLLYDEIGSGLKIRQLQRDKAELFEQLESYYKAFIAN